MATKTAAEKKADAADKKARAKVDASLAAEKKRLAAADKKAAAEEKAAYVKALATYKKELASYKKKAALAKKKGTDPGPAPVKPTEPGSTIAPKLPVTTIERSEKDLRSIPAAKGALPEPDPGTAPAGPQGPIHADDPGFVPQPPPTAPPEPPPTPPRAIDAEPQGKGKKAQRSKLAGVDVHPDQALLYSAIPHDVEVQHAGRYHTVKGAGYSVVAKDAADHIAGPDESPHGGSMGAQGVARLFPPGHAREGENFTLIAEAELQYARFLAKRG